MRKTVRDDACRNQILHLMALKKLVQIILIFHIVLGSVMYTSLNTVFIGQKASNNLFIVFSEGKDRC